MIYKRRKEKPLTPIKAFKQAVWEIRKQYGRQYLTKKHLAEAFQLYKQAGENKERFKELVKGMLN